ncbi:Conserved_hypothetical protein [Hexamita inflata]|uniref:Myb-like DNA-binding domain-containing protein n=1 Tax=Hexamita inflata TaxID=28002 RepID=A0AA86R3D1_9EUKA|nr:Conserved hypothetical protein [Hexamita inflata]
MSYHVWTSEEIDCMVTRIRKYNYNWEEFQALELPNLSVAQIKNKFYSNKEYKILANQKNVHHNSNSQSTNIGTQTEPDQFNIYNEICKFMNQQNDQTK